MKVDRVREVLGVWAPMGVGLFIIVTSVNFYFNAPLVGGILMPDLEPWRLACSAGTFFVGVLLILSTYGRYTKAREARRETPANPSLPPPALPPDEESDREGSDDH